MRYGPCFRPVKLFDLGSFGPLPEVKTDDDEAFAMCRAIVRPLPAMRS